MKFILGTLLSEKYQVYVPPASYNTPMGLSRVIRSQLRPYHQVFVAEMGARHRGDIRELCRLVKPRYGVLTAVGEQHLDTFKTLDNIRETKYDLIRALPEDGCSFFPDDGGICAQLWERTGGRKRLVSLKAGPNADVWADQVKVSENGSSFRLFTREGSVDCETQLLGAHNIQNILLAASVALELGLSLKELQRGIARLRPVEHRLQLLPGSGGITVIDDAFNSNPAGADAALQVIGQFPGRRLIITPGMVELGDREEEANRSMGQHMAACVDEAILIGGRHTAPIRQGLLDAGFDEAHIHTVSSLAEAQALLGRIGLAGDTVLFENDLPDNYTE